MQVIKMIRSFRPALLGLKSAFVSENNIRFHLLAVILVVAAGVYFHLPSGAWLWIVAAIGTVLTVEYMNTAIEKLTDMVAPEFDERAGNVKDIAAAAVLIATLMAIVIGVIIFLPYLST